jgi:hypothetical protein
VPGSGGSNSRAYRSSATAPVATYLAILFLVIVGMGVGILAGAYPVSRTTGGKVLGALSILYGLMGLAWAILRVRRMGVVVSDQGVLLRNWVRSTRSKWQDIACFEFGDQLKSPSLRESLGTPELQPYAVMKTGKHVSLAGLTSTRLAPRTSRERVQRLLDELNQDLETHTNPQYHSQPSAQL